jgi:predicted dehydrogenase
VGSSTTRTFRPTAPLAFPVVSIWNRTRERAERLAAAFGIPEVAPSLDDLIAGAPCRAVLDLALMRAQFVDTLERLPDGAAVLIQKPMGDNFEGALDILDVMSTQAAHRGSELPTPLRALCCGRSPADR